jgi:hypothetical protein
MKIKSVIAIGLTLMMGLTCVLFGGARADVINVNAETRYMMSIVPFGGVPIGGIGERIDFHSRVVDEYTITPFFTKL